MPNYLDFTWLPNYRQACGEQEINCFSSISNIALGVANLDHVQAAEAGCEFERKTFMDSSSKVCTKGFIRLVTALTRDVRRLTTPL